MAVRFLTGKPGDGKSMTAVQALQRELITGKRQIVTNLPLFVGRTWSFLKSRFGADIDVDRITILTEDDTREFYLHRGRGYRAAAPTKDSDGRIDYAQCLHADGTTKNANDLPPVLYIIDEAHLHFGSRQWQDTAKAALFYLSQHRKRGDEVFFVTQHVKQVDSALRRLAAEFWRVTNYGARFPFGVKLPDVFVVDVFTAEPSLLSSPIDTRSMRLDVEGLASCYDTAAGVGMVGNMADKVKTRKGIPWQVALVCLVVLLACGFLLPIGVGKAFAKSLPRQSGQTNSLALLSTVTNSPPLVVATNALPAPRVEPPFIPRVIPGGMIMAETPTSKLVVRPGGEPEKLPKVRMILRKANSVTLELDNGDRFTLGDGRIEIVGKLAILDGNKAYRLPE